MEKFGLTVGERVRWTPGVGVYGYDDMLESDGTLQAEVIGFGSKRVRIVVFSSRTARRVSRSVGALRLSKVA